VAVQPDVPEAKRLQEWIANGGDKVTTSSLAAASPSGATFDQDTRAFLGRFESDQVPAPARMAASR